MKSPGLNETALKKGRELAIFKVCISVPVRHHRYIFKWL